MRPLSRRAFLTNTAAFTATAVASPVLLSACGSADAAAYRYWQQKDKGPYGDLEYMTLCATLAPSAHNTQPWQFRLLGDHIQVFADTTRNLASADAQQRMMLMSVGCATENLGVAARKLGYRSSVELQDNGLGATVNLRRVGNGETHPWFDAMFTRQTTRTAFEPLTAPPESFMQTLSQQLADLPGIGLSWFSADNARADVAGVTRSSVRQFLANDAHHRDGMQWFRITREEWEKKGDGIAIFNSDASPVAKQYVEWFVTPQDLLSADFKQGEIDATDRAAQAAPLWGLIHAAQSSPQNCVQAGRLAERAYLEATARGWALQPLCYGTETDEGRAQLRKIAGLSAEADPLFLFRVGTSSHHAHSTRRPLRDVILS